MTTCISGVRLEVAMSKQEKEKIEEILLRWRGVKNMDVQLVRQQGMRLQNMRYEPKAELAPMRGLRPADPETRRGEDDPE